MSKQKAVPQVSTTEDLIDELKRGAYNIVVVTSCTCDKKHKTYSKWYGDPLVCLGLVSQIQNDILTEMKRNEV